MLSSTPSETEITSAETAVRDIESVKDIKSQKTSWLVKTCRALVLSLSLAGVASGCATVKPPLKNRIMDVMRDIVGELGARYAGIQTDGSAITCEDGDEFSEAKAKAIKENEELLETTELEHSMGTRQMAEANKWIACVRSVKLKTTPKTPIEGMQILLGEMGYTYCGKTGDTVLSCGKGTTKEEAESEARKGILDHYEHGTFYTPDIRPKQIEDGTWVAVAKTFPRSQRKSPKSDGTEDPSVSVDESNIVITRKEQRAIDNTPKSDKDFALMQLRQSLGSFRDCHERVLKRDPSVGGKIAIIAHINPDGSIGKVQFRNNTLKNVTVQSCIAHRIKRWRFPSASDNSPRIIEFESIKFKAPAQD